MKRLIPIALLVGLTTANSFAQTFSPAGGTALSSGTLGQVYADQVLNFVVPSTADVDVSALSPIPIPGIPTVSADVINVTWSVEGLPSGMTATCDATPCTYVTGASGSITIGGTPTESGTFTININSSTNGSATLPAPISQTIAFPQALPGLLDEDGYTLLVTNPNGIAEQNKIFSLGFYPNPTEGQSVLDLNTSLSGMATVEVYSITGSMVKTSTHAVRMGANRLSLDLSGLRAGIYMVKADINGHQALIRIQKK